MQIPLWEWTVADGARNAACGVSATRDKAMDALSRTLLSGDGYARGLVAPMVLVDSTGPVPIYLRGAPMNHAEYDSGVITWRRNGDKP